MADKVVSTCASCGARLDESSDKCPLCGWVIGTEDHDIRSSGAAAIPAAPAPSSKETSTPQPAVGLFCHNCGKKNPLEANFCIACGTKLIKEEVLPEGVKKADPPAELTEKPVEPVDEGPTESSGEEDLSEEARDEESVPAKTRGAQVAMMLTASVLLVAALYMITAFSKRAFPTSETPPPAEAEASAAEVSQEAAPLSADLEARIQALTSEAESLSGDDQLNKKREIVGILMGVQRYDRAAPVQEEIAASSNSQQDWIQTGHFYSDWMEQLSGAERGAIAQNAVTAYEKGLEIGPDDLNARTALAMAYLNTNTPMLGITQIRQVLDEEPDHLQGNFYFGVMLMQINRVEQAKERFERVKELTSTSDPIHQQADIMLRNINSITQ